MASVYLAYDSLLGVPRAIKVLSRNLAARGNVQRRFAAEARTMAQIRHPNVVSVFDVLLLPNLSAIVMEYVEGGSLFDLLEQRGMLSTEEALAVMHEVAAGVEAAHQLGVIHRDIKPHNVLIELDGTPKLSDFGIARRLEQSNGFTRTGAVLGTMAFMAPEQRSGADDIDPRADVYAMGATLYLLVTGRTPFDLYATEFHQRLFEGVPAVVSAIVKKACCFSPDERHESAMAFREHISQSLVDGNIRDLLPRPTAISQSKDRMRLTTAYDPTFDFESLEHEAAPDVSQVSGADSLPSPGALSGFGSWFGTPDIGPREVAREGEQAADGVASKDDVLVKGTPGTGALVPSNLAGPESRPSPAPRGSFWRSAIAGLAIVVVGAGWWAVSDLSPSLVGGRPAESDRSETASGNHTELLVPDTRTAMAGPVASAGSGQPGGNEQPIVAVEREETGLPADVDGRGRTELSAGVKPVVGTTSPTAQKRPPAESSASPSKPHAKPRPEPLVGAVSATDAAQSSPRVPPPTSSSTAQPLPEPAALPAPETVPTGTLVVNTIPPGRYRVGSQSGGTPEFGVSLPDGTHTVHFDHPDGAVGSMTIRIRSDSTTRVCWSFVDSAPCSR